ncbi:hypothetical protein CY35_14G020000 [Sphagnum magellanicum]|nr:hypothetical protein CY35_14G020000 [Sphagnum magellanicum]
MHSETGQKFVCSRGVSVTTTTVATPTLRRHGEAVCKQPNCSQPNDMTTAQSAKHAPGTEASTVGYADSGRTGA